MKYGIDHRPVISKEIAKDFFYIVLIVSKEFSLT